MPRFSIFYLILLVGIIVEGAWGEKRIVGGALASQAEFPYQISLRLRGSHLCGGSIISDRHILTAAHCVNELTAPYTDVTVVTGTNSLLNGGKTYKIKAIKYHPDYVGTREASWINDVAVISLQTPIEFNAAQKPIELAVEDPPVGAQVTVTGWGRITTKGPLSTELLKTTQFVESNSQCESTHSERIYDSQICALRKNGIGACNGDSGGPLTYNNRVVGIVSWVYLCAVGISDVYTRVSAHLPFIKAAMNSI